jgi:hypothetical protein
VLRKIFLPERLEVTEDWKKMHNEKLHLLCSSPNTVWVVMSGGMRSSGKQHVQGRKEMQTGF